MSGAPGRQFQLAAAGLTALVPVYFLVQTAYVMLTRLTSGPAAGGLAILPYSLLVVMALTFLFFWLSGWYRDLDWRRFGAWSLPVPARETVLSGIGSAMMLSVIPLAYSLPEVSIPLMLVLQRGGVLAAAPLVDLLNRRRIHWWSIVALLLVATALLMVLHARGSRLPSLAVLIVALYNIGFVLRLMMMTRIAKRGDLAGTRRYFVEEKLVALPLGSLALVMVVAFGTQASGGFAAIVRPDWSLPLAGAVLGMGVLMAMASLVTALILLNARENTFCVPLERACSLLAGLAAAWLLHLGWQQASPASTELHGAVLLLLAVALLALAGRKTTTGRAGS